jgi:Tfp pilus assembly protein PilO
MIKLPKKRLIIVLAAGGGITALLLYFIFYAPLIRELKIRYLECKSIESQLRDAHNTIESAGESREQKVLVTVENVSEAIDGLAKQCSLMNVTVLSINLKKIKEEGDLQFKVLPIEMEIKSTFQQFAVFIGSLAKLESGLIKVKSFDLAPDSKDKTKLKANLVLDMCIANAE